MKSFSFLIASPISLLCLILHVPILLAGTININAELQLSESGQDDLELIRNYCGAASRPETELGAGDTTAGYLSQIKFRRIRGVSIDDNNSIDNTGTFIPGTRLSQVLEDAKKYGYSPLIVVGLKKPSYLPPNAWSWSSDVWNDYRDYAYKLVRYVALDYQGGFSTSIFEVGNETEILPPELIWTQQEPGYLGSLERYTHLITLYAIWQEAVNRVASEIPSRQILVAGPNITTFGSFLAPFSWKDTFIDDVANNNWRLDLLTFHAYGDNGGAVANGPPHPIFSALKDQLQSMRDKLNSRGRGYVGIYNTEWGASSFADSSSLARINYTHEGAAWTVAFFKDVVSKAVVDGVQLIMRDNVGAEPTGNASLSSLLHLKDGVEYPKPIFNACKMFMLMPGTRKSVSTPSNQLNLVAIASGSSNSIAAIVANYNYLFDYPNQNFTDLSVPEKVTVQFTGVPFSGKVKVQQYLIDAYTSNLAKYLDNAQTPDYNGTQLQKVWEKKDVKVSAGSVSLPQVTLEKSAVSLWVIQSQN
jgi:hypothetical protein